jgi:murein DD-endopeptidase MepM/ murein hydrolase activator NlpD
MNGRVYDYNLGRFLSVDPFIQAPTNSQSANPYSYIMNNPMAGTDPTGYMASNWRTSACDLDNSCASTPVDRAFSTYVGNGQQNELSTVAAKTLEKMESDMANVKLADSLFAERIGYVEISEIESTNVGGNWSSASHHEDPSKDSSTKTDEDGWHNPTGKDVRGCDKGGCGEFGASRKRDGKSVKGAHKGADYLGNEGQTIRAPHRGAVARVIDKDKYGNPLDGVVVGDGKGNSWKMLYINHKLKKGDAVGGNQIIGTLNDLSKYGYPDYVPNHAHLKIRVNSTTVDPEEYIK